VSQFGGTATERSISESARVGSVRLRLLESPRVLRQGTSERSGPIAERRLRALKQANEVRSARHLLCCGKPARHSHTLPSRRTERLRDVGQTFTEASPALHRRRV
jgi:hypothetical protein